MDKSWKNRFLIESWPQESKQILRYQKIPTPSRISYGLYYRLSYQLKGPYKMYIFSFFEDRKHKSVFDCMAQSGSVCLIHILMIKNLFEEIVTTQISS